MSSPESKDYDVEKKWVFSCVNYWLLGQDQGILDRITTHEIEAPSMEAREAFLSYVNQVLQGKRQPPILPNTDFNELNQAQVFQASGGVSTHPRMSDVASPVPSVARKPDATSPVPSAARKRKSDDSDWTPSISSKKSSSKKSRASLGSGGSRGSSFKPRGQVTPMTPEHLFDALEKNGSSQRGLFLPSDGDKTKDDKKDSDKKDGGKTGKTSKNDGGKNEGGLIPESKLFSDGKINDWMKRKYDCERSDFSEYKSGGESGGQSGGPKKRKVGYIKFYAKNQPERLSDASQAFVFVQMFLTIYNLQQTVNGLRERVQELEEMKPRARDDDFSSGDESD